MKLPKYGFNEEREIYGIDFSGAANAGKKIWIARAVLEKEMLLIQDCYRAETLPGSGKDCASCVTALRNFIKWRRQGAFGLDFPFGLPKPLVEYKSWEKFITAFPTRYESPEAFRGACLAAAGGIELKRAADMERGAPFSPYNLRPYRQTYFGISGILSPLVRHHLVCVLPMQKALAEKPWLLEICPASTLKSKDLYFPYKGGSAQHKEARLRLLETIEKAGPLRVPNPTIRKTVVEDPDGDALDSLIAALATSNALQNKEALSSEMKNSDTIEGTIYV